DIVKILFGGKTETGEGDLANQIVGVDVRVHLPVIKTDLYYERGMEDFRDFYPYKHAYIVGAYMADLLGFSLRTEFFDSTEYPGVWYRHETFTSGYTFKKRVIGHHAGGDAEDFFVEIGREINDYIKISASFDLETRGTNQPVVERHRQYLGQGRFRIYPYVVEIQGGWEEVDNPGFAPGKGSNSVGIIKVKRFF
ncbi:MAG: hypothetical protein GTO08_03720, partial [Deltaproteobacteria bacterium]|nr:hypothetical protein [Deltaproteobacteria bacterium]